MSSHGTECKKLSFARHTNRCTLCEGAGQLQVQHVMQVGEWKHGTTARRHAFVAGTCFQGRVTKATDCTDPKHEAQRKSQRVPLKWTRHVFLKYHPPKTEFSKFCNVWRYIYNVLCAYGWNKRIPRCCFKQLAKVRSKGVTWAIVQTQRTCMSCEGHHYLTYIRYWTRTP